MKSNDRQKQAQDKNKTSWGVLLVLCGAIFLEGIDVSMLGVALPSIRADLGMSTSSLQWVVSAYVLGYGGFMLLGGRAADLFGRRRMFLFWLTVFLVFSGLGGFATNGWVLILARFMTGVSAAFMTPAGLSIITTSFSEGVQRNKALSIYAGTAAGGFSLGLVAGGMLTELSWRWVFFGPVIFSFIILVAGYRLIKNTGSPEQSGQGFDLAGAISLTVAMLLLVFAVVESPNIGSNWTIGTLAASAVLFAVFVAVEKRTASPLVRLGILRSGSLIRANLGGMLFAGSFFGFQFITVLYLQELRGWSSLETGLALLAIGIDAVLSPTLTPRLVSRFGNVRVIFWGFCLAAVAYTLFMLKGLDSIYAVMLPFLLLVGFAFALAYGPLTIAATDGIREEEQGLAGGLFNTSFQFGAALGLALVTTVYVSASGAAGMPQADLNSFRTALIVPVAGVVLGAVTVAFGFRKRTKSTKEVHIS
ncbi:MFS transporter [Brevibacillus brevis]|uniref:MFS transporter n=1 Tax=Brevibacillus brevis TaxID=1393 RepID=A0ABY9TA19_BREBE|nr:MFS transporter [Brevibacillus brevis]WNC15223.1 MFS transporter [Brevibacillus brevis]